MTSPLRYPLDDMRDVPACRDSVGAMGWAGNQQPDPFRPYVYRGTGQDQYDAEYDVKVPQPEPSRPRKPKPRFSTRLRLHYRPELPAPPYAPATNRYIAPRPKPKTIRTSPGWRPMTGADVEALLESLRC